MALEYEMTTRKLLRGNREVTIRVMTREDLPAMRRFDRESTALLDEANRQVPPGRENWPGGPWSEDEWLALHFAKYEQTGNITLIAEDDEGRIVGFADLWVGHEPEPFGEQLAIVCVDYFRDYYAAGLESLFFEEAEKVARAAGLPKLSIGTNTASGDYPTMRGFGFKVSYEYDQVLCRCQPVPTDWALDHRNTALRDADFTGLIKVGHWSPAGFSYLEESDKPFVAEFSVDGHRTLLLLWEEECCGAVGAAPGVPSGSDLYVTPEVLGSPESLSRTLRDCAFLAGGLGTKTINLPCPSDMEVDPGLVDVLERRFMFAWMVKKLTWL